MWGSSVSMYVSSYLEAVLQHHARLLRLALLQLEASVVDPHGDVLFELAANHLQNIQNQFSFSASTNTRSH